MNYDPEFALEVERGLDKLRSYKEDIEVMKTADEEFKSVMLNYHEGLVDIFEHLFDLKKDYDDCYDEQNKEELEKELSEFYKQVEGVVADLGSFVDDLKVEQCDNHSS